MTEKTRLTVKGNNYTVFFYEEKRSRFICHTFHVESEQEAKEAIREVQKKFYDASHNCYAYIVSNNGVPLKKFSDEGEPRGTAGKPILRVLESKGMVDTLCVVTRYFGGTLLGAGGLVRAYSKAAAAGIETVKKQKITESIHISIVTDYHDFNTIERLIREMALGIPEVEYSHVIRVKALVTEEVYLRLSDEIFNATKGRAIIKVRMSEMDS